MRGSQEREARTDIRVTRPVVKEMYSGMNPLLIIVVIVALVGLLVYRRKRGATASKDAGPSPMPAVDPAPTSSAPVPLARPADVTTGVASTPMARPSSPPPPSNWVPEETIVEPGWPLPGEISGAWSPVTTDTGAAAAVRDAPVPAVAPVEAQAPVAEIAAVESADEWLMPESAPVAWSPGTEFIAPVSDPEPEPEPEPAYAAPVYAADEAAVTTWDVPAPAAVATEPEIAPEIEAAGSEVGAEAEAELPLWTPVAGPEPEPVLWTLDAPAEPAVAEPEPAPEPAPMAAWVDSLPEPTPEPEIAPQPEPAPFLISEPEPFVVAEPSTAPEAAVDPRDQSLAVAELAPLLEGLLPLTRVSDRVGVTPRMLALMRTLASAPLSVSEQARLLDVSRPVVADLSARLESLGLARRERDAADRRRVRIALTERGHRLCEEAPGTPEPSAIAERLALMEPAERDELIRGVRALERVAAAR